MTVKKTVPQGLKDQIVWGCRLWDRPSAVVNQLSALIPVFCSEVQSQLRGVRGMEKGANRRKKGNRPSPNASRRIVFG